VSSVRVPAEPSLKIDAGTPDVLILRDGSVATVRDAGPQDRDAVERFFRSLSPEASRHRFFCSGDVPAGVVDRLCNGAQPAEGLTLLAVRGDSLLGTASYLKTTDRVAEAAFAVDDHYAGKGIATGLLERLAERAAAEGFERFQATTLADNAAMLAVFRDSGFTIRSKPDAGIVDVELSLTPSARTLAVRDERERAATAASIRPLFEPAAVAVIGASRDRASIGRRVFDALASGRFSGPIYPVNPNTAEIGGVKAYRSVRELPGPIDLAVITVPAGAVLDAVDDCAAIGVKSLVVITAGFAEAGDAGRHLQAELVARVRGYGMRLVGPNCMGLLNARTGLNASFSPAFPPAGRVAMSSQSGALGIALLSLAGDRQLGLSTFVSVGNKADVSGNDLLQYWESDPATSVILLYLESFGNPRRFARLARRIGLKKPIVAVKAGRTRAGSRAAGSHTAALAANEVAVDALFHQAGVIRADTIDEMFDIAACLDLQPLPTGRRVAIVTNAGGPGILAVDACEAAGLSAAEFSENTQARLRTILPPMASLINPVDMVASAGPDQYRHSVQTALEAEETDALIVIYTPVDASSSHDILKAISDGIAAARLGRGAGKPVLACFMAEHGAPVPLAAGEERIPAYPFPENAARALGKVSAYAAWRSQSPGLFWSFNDLHIDDARALCRDVLDSRGEDWLTPEELRRLLGAFGLQMLPGLVARTADDAVARAEMFGYPVAAKLIAHELVHKSDIGGVRLNLASAEEARQAFTELMAIAHSRRVAEDQRTGVLIQPMCVGGTETFVGLVEDPLFGALVGVGLGGVHVEAFGDVHFRIAPLTDRDADDLIRGTRGVRLLEAGRGRPRADIEALNEVVLRVSLLAESVPEIAELDLNPVIVLEAGKGYRIVDARARVKSLRS
jgi:acetyl coenzyme A synthetase (ADP forming)-like protein